MANVVEQAQQMIPLIAGEISFGQNVSKLVFGVDVFDFVSRNPEVIRSNSQSRETLLSPGNMSHCGTLSFNNHLDHCFIVLEHLH